MKKPIFISAAPNIERDDFFLILKNLFTPWTWFGSLDNKKLHQKVAEYFGPKYGAIGLDSARSAIYLLLKTKDIGPGDEVLLPSFSCLVIANPVIWAGAKPVYVDIDLNTFNIDLNSLSKKVTPKTKAILVQHTFGMPVDVEKVREIVGPDVLIIEDVAHALGGEFQGKKLGTFGDAAILTFGIEKVISCGRGGMIVSAQKSLMSKIAQEVQALPRFSFARVFGVLLNPLLWFVATPLYYMGWQRFSLGRFIIFLGQRLNIMGNVIEKCEYQAQKPSWLPARMPGVLARLALHQFEKLERFNLHRTQNAILYSKALGINYPTGAKDKHIYLRFPLLIEQPEQLLRAARQEKIILGDWYKSILYAPKTSHALLNYQAGDTPNAEFAASRIVNLPTGINVDKESAERIINIVKKYL